MIIIGIFDHNEGITALIKGFPKAAKYIGVSTRTLRRWHSANPCKHYNNYTIHFYNELILSDQGGRRKSL